MVRGEAAVFLSHSRLHFSFTPSPCPLPPRERVLLGQDCALPRKLESSIFKLETPPVGEFTSDSSSLAAGVAGGAGVGQLACVEIGCSHPALAARAGLWPASACGDGGGARPRRAPVEKTTGRDEHLLPDGSLAKRPQRRATGGP